MDDRTCNDGFERCSCDGDVAVLDHEHVVAGRHRCVGEFVAFGNLRADERHLRRTVDVNGQGPGTGVRRNNRELGSLT